MVENIQLSQDDIVLPEYRGRLLEGVTYNPSNDTLLWVDIINAEVHRISLHDKDYSKGHQVLKFNEPNESIGNIELTGDDNIVIVCAKYGIAKGNFSKNSIEYFLKYNHDDDQKKRLRSNDGLIDPWGHLWIGVMTDFPISKEEGIKPEGRLYRVNCHDLTIDLMEKDTFISNGLAFSADRKKLYYTDSFTNCVWVYDYDYISNKLSNKKAVANFKNFVEGEHAEPDGLVISDNEFIFSALYKGSCVAKFTTEGKILQKFILPSRLITCVTIGGKDYNTLFITTAHENHVDSGAKIDANDKSGDLGGYLYQFKFKESLGGKVVTNTWGGK